jgi:endonuclease G, mitochondrial
LLKPIIFLIFCSVNLFSADLFLKQFFNKKQCDQILENNGFFKTCYSYKYKGAKFVSYTLYGDKVNLENLKDRPKFYDDLNIPKKYRSSYSDYTHNIFNADRGHLYPDAAADWSQKSLKSVYVMSNIIPQHQSLNRSIHSWKGLERYGRSLAKKLNKINVLNGVIYSENSKRIGRNNISIPDSFWKMYYNDNHNFRRCFYFKNKTEVKGMKLRDYEVDCKKIL